MAKAYGSISVILVFLFISCGGSLRQADSLPPAEKYPVALKLFEKGSYLKAKTLFDSIARLNLFESYADSAQFLLAECEYKLHDYILAEHEYERLIIIRPGSRLVPKARFMRGMSFLQLSPSPQHDQEHTYKAITAFEDYLIDPAAKFDMTMYNEAVKNITELYSKLAEKEYRNGVLYKRMGDYEAALTYFNGAMFSYNTYGFVSIIPKALFESGECYMKMKKYSDAKEKYEALKSNFPEHELISKAEKRLSELKKYVKPDTTFIR